MRILNLASQVHRARGMIFAMNEAGYLPHLVLEAVFGLLVDRTKHGLHAFWTIADQKGAHAVTLFQFKRAMAFTGLGDLEEEIPALFRLMDTHGDGCLAYPQFVELVSVLLSKV